MIPVSVNFTNVSQRPAEEARLDRSKKEGQMSRERSDRDSCESQWFLIIMLILMILIPLFAFGSESESPWIAKEARQNVEKQQRQIMNCAGEHYNDVLKQLHQLACERERLAKRVGDADAIVDDMKAVRAGIWREMDDCVQKYMKDVEKLEQMYFTIHRDQLKYFDERIPEQATVIHRQEEVRKALHKAHEQAKTLKQAWDAYRSTEKWEIPAR